MKKILGFLLLFFVFCFLFSITAIEKGIITASIIWGTSLVIAAVFVCSIELIFSDR